MGIHLSWNIIILAFSLALAGPSATAVGAELSQADKAALQNGAKAYKRGKYRQARDLLLPLAEQGIAEAQVLVGTMYAGGRALPMDGAQSAKWLRKAAEQGNSEGEYKLGLLYASGWGVPEDLNQAEQWIAKAAAQGHPKARKRLPKIKAEAQKARLAPPPAVAAAERRPPGQETAAAEDTLDADVLDSGEGIDADMLEGGEILVAEGDDGGEEIIVAEEEGLSPPPATPAPAPTPKAKPAPPKAKPAALHAKPKPAPAVKKSRPAPKPPTQAKKPGSAPKPAPRVKQTKPAEQPVTAKTTPRAAPAKAGGLHGTAWIRQRDPSHYTIQLMASWKMADVSGFVARHRLAGDHLAYVRSVRRGKPWYSLITGDYASKREAMEARRKLKPALIKGSPWIRRYRDIQKSLAGG